MVNTTRATRFRFWLRLIRIIGVIVPRRLRADWKQEWEAELRNREVLLADWDKIDRKAKFDLFRRSLGAFWDALALQPQRLEDEMFQDVRFGFRQAIRKPGLIIAAVFCLAFGIGANILVFGLINAVVLRPAPGVAAPEELAVIMNRTGEDGYDLTSYPDYLDYRNHNQSFTDLLAYRAMHVSLSIDGSTERIQGAVASENYFSVLGVGTANGRSFLVEEDQTPGAYPVAVISHGLWQRRFGGDPAITGRTVKLNGHSFTITGVAQAGFTGTETGEVFDIWFPTAMQAEVIPQSVDRLRSRDHRWLLMIGRLKSGVSIEQAQQEVDVIAAQIRQAYPKDHAGITSILVSPHVGLGPIDYPTVSRFLNTVLAVAAVVLLIACANVANLLLVRANGRRKEIAIRLALGATRPRIVRQFLTESMLLTAAATSLGLLIPVLASHWLLALFPPLTPEALNFNPDFRVIGFAVTLSLATALVFGLLPAIQASKSDVVPELKEAVTRGARRWRLSSIFVTAQIAITVTLLICAGLLVRTLQRFYAVDPGFETESVLALSLDLKSQGYTEAGGQQLYRRLIERTGALPAVESVALASVMPLGWGSPSQAVFIEGQQQPSPDRPLMTDHNIVTPGWFQTMGIPLITGRDFSNYDAADAPGVVIINEAMAHRYWPDRQPIGLRFEIGEKQRRTVEIIGIARNSKHRTLEEEPRPLMYLPLLQQYESRMILHVRSAVDPLSLVGAVRLELQRLDSSVPLFEIKTLAQRLSESIWPTRTMSKLLVIFGLLALLLALVGLYGVLSYAVTQRTREIGIRIALGARPAQVLKLIIGQGMILVSIGICLGLFSAFAVTRILQSFLYGVSATDPLTFIAITVVLGLGALLSCYLPARQATQVDPMTTIRHE